MTQLITTPQQAVAYAKSELIVPNDARERCVIITLTGNRPIRANLVGIGSYHTCIADTRYVAKIALLDNASAVILLHTHSGDCRPSQSDLKTTDSIRRGLSCLDIKLLDHIIVGQDSYFSFSDENVAPLD